MSDRVPYEILAPEAHKLLAKLLSASDEDAPRIYREYILLLNMNGWTDALFDAYTLEKVNSSWEPKPPHITSLN